MKMTRLTTNKSKIAFYKMADAKQEADFPTLVLGHALGIDHTMWSEVLDFLPDSLNVILWDQPGHGHSKLLGEESEEGTTLSLFDAASELRTGLQELGVLDEDRPAPVIGGLSLGGMVSLAFAENYPEELSGLVMCSSGAVLEPSEAWIQKAAQVRSEGVAQLVEPTLERWFSDDFRLGVGADEVNEIRNVFLKTSPEGYAQCCELISATDMREGTALVQVPTLLIAGEHDAGMTPAQADDLAETFPNASTEVVPGAKHLTAVENPTLVGNYLSEFLGLD